MKTSHSDTKGSPVIGSTGRLILKIDCAADIGADAYFEHGRVRVVASPLGAYREAKPVPLSRFGYRFQIDNIGKPHVAIIRYPDDKRRYMCIHDGTGFDLTTGVITGGAQPLSGRMLVLKQIFWPRWKDCSIVITTWSQGEPAAVESVEIRELDALEAAPGGLPHDRIRRRQFGIQFEDPCGSCFSEGARTKSEWIERITDYLKHSGQSTLIYPMAWYHGPLFPSALEKPDALEVVVAEDRKQYVRWTTKPADWYPALLKRFEQEGLSFVGSLTLLRLSSLMEKMNADMESIVAGADTINNVTFDNKVRAGTFDSWTYALNAQWLAKAADTLKAGGEIEPYGLPVPGVYGERYSNQGQVLAGLAEDSLDTPAGSPNICEKPGPIFNPLHPEVQDALLAFIGEVADRYAGFSSFSGVSINLYAGSMLWFGSLRNGYDDFTAEIFERETGIRIPVDPRAPDRFSRRYEFLAFVCRNAWVEWRCLKTRELIRKMVEALRMRRADLRLGITVWQETLVPFLLERPITEAYQIFSRQGIGELCRDGGLDLDLLEGVDGLDLDLEIDNNRDRGWGFAGVDAPLHETKMFRDHEFLDDRSNRSVRNHPRGGAFIFNSWVEAWGKHVWFEPEPDDPNLEWVRRMGDATADRVLRMNSVYPPDGFWWDSQWRITPGLPAGDHFLEPYAHAVAELDACRITRGGILIDKAHTEELRRFGAAYRALPDQKFEDVGPGRDPVVVRTLVTDGLRYFYAVNRECHPCQVTLEFTAGVDAVTDLATGAEIRVGSDRMLLELGPYELRSYSMRPQVSLTGFEAVLPAVVADELLGRARDVLAALRKAREEGLQTPGIGQTIEMIGLAIQQQSLSKLRHCLDSYVVLLVTSSLH